MTRIAQTVGANTTIGPGPYILRFVLRACELQNAVTDALFFFLKPCVFKTKMFKYISYEMDAKWQLLFAILLRSHLLSFGGKYCLTSSISKPIKLRVAKLESHFTNSNPHKKLYIEGNEPGLPKDYSKDL